MARFKLFPPEKQPFFVAKMILMKRCFLLFWLLQTMTAPLYAQNWFPLAPGDRFNFRHSDSALISNVIQVDSQKLLPNGDQAFFLNRIVTDCDTCVFQPGKLGNQGQFLQKTMLLKPDGRWVFSGKITFVLFPQAQVGETWLLDTAQNRTATVQNIAALEVLGESDSVKTIALSDGAQILLSKNHGLLQFPDGDTGAAFDLAGIPTRNLGEKLPGWQEFYDFETGDILEYESDLSTDPGTPARLHTLEKRRILNRFWDADTLVYAVEQFHYHYLQWSGPPFPFYSHEIIYWRIHPALAEPQTIGYPGQFFAAGPVVAQTGYGSRVFWNMDTTYGLSQVFGIVQYPFQWEGCSLFAPPVGTEETVLPCDGCGPSFHRRHSVGLGLTSHANSCFEFWDYGQLNGWIKNGDTSGILTPDSFFLVSLRPEPLAIPVQVAPNPSAGDWQLLFPETATETLHFDLYNMHGQRLLQGVIEQGARQQIIPGSEFPTGVYLLKIQGKNGVKPLKLIKQ